MPGELSRIVAFDPYYERFINTNVRCLATEASLWWNQHSDGVTTDINLGPFACPGGYATATISSINEYTSFAGCCPSEYKFVGTLLPAASLGQYYSPLSSGQTFVAKTTFEGNIGSWVDTKVQVNTTGVQVVAVHVNGFVFHEETSTLPASNSASTTQSGTTPTVTSAIPSNTQTGGGHIDAQTGPPTISAILKTEGVSSSTKIGVGVGVSFAVVGVLCLIATMILLRRRARRHDYVNEVDAAVERSEPTTGHSFFAKPSWNRAHGRKVYEVSGESRKRSHDVPIEMWVSPTHGG